MNRKMKIAGAAMAALLAVGCVTALNNDDEPAPRPAATTTTTTAAPTTEAPAPEPTEPAPEPTATEPEVPAEYKAALRQADTYANRMHLSKRGLYDQLTSDYGGQFPPEAAQYAVDNVKADWNRNALEQAKTYQDMGLSRAAIHDQLTSDYGGQFTEAEADYALANL